MVQTQESQSHETTMKPDLSIIIVNFNAGRWLSDCLRSLFHHVRQIRFEVLVVDNGSADSSLDGIMERYPDLRILRSSFNQGFANAVNQGVEASTGRYILLLNPDTTVLNSRCADWIQYMDEHPKVGISGAKVFDDESRDSVQMSCRRFPSLSNYFFNRYSLLTRLFPNNKISKQYLMSDWNHQQTSSVDWVSGCCMLLRRKMLDEIGLMDEHYHLFSEDVDLCYRAHQAGWEIVFNPLMEIAHHVGSIRAQADIRAIIDRHRSLWHFCKKFYRRSVWLQSVIAIGIIGRLCMLVTLSICRKAVPVLTDAVLIQFSVFLSLAARQLWPYPWTTRVFLSYLDIAIWYTLIQISILFALGLYARPRVRQDDYLDILPAVIKAASFGTLMLVFTVFFDQQFVFPRSIILFSWFFNIILFAGWRWMRLYRSHKGLGTKRVLIYGTGYLAGLVSREMLQRFTMLYHPVGYIRSLNSVDQKVDSTMILGSLDDVGSVISRHQIDEVVFADEARHEDEIVALMNQCQTAHLNTRLAPDLYESELGISPLNHFQVPLLDPEARPNSSYESIKRLLDLAASLLLMMMVSPLMALIALRLKFGHRGSVLSKKENIGKAGKVFTCYKFRKTNDSSASDENILEMTSFGRFLRMTRLDELPQLFNVLKGDMSLIGPQPETVETAQVLTQKVTLFPHRLRVRPGMTGWAQVELKYPASIEAYHEKLQYDLYYVKNMSLAFDFKILLKSFWMVISGKGVR